MNQCSLINSSIYLLFGLTLCLVSCKDNDNTNFADIELVKYLTRENIFIAAASKEVPAKPLVTWCSDAKLFDHTKNTLTVYLANYSDTLNWRQLENLANLRDLIVFSLNPNIRKRQLIVSNSSYNLDTTKLAGVYFKYTDGGDITDAVWDIDDSKDNFVQISKIDSSTDFVLDAEFDLSFKLAKQSSIPGRYYSENVRFKNGMIHGKLIK